MKRPTPWFYWLLFFVCGIVIIGEYIALSWLAPHYVLHLVERAAGGTLAVDEARLSFPVTTLTGLRLVNGTPQSTLSIQRVVIKPRWLSLLSKTVLLNSVQIEHPFLRLTRTKNGTMLWPALSVPVTAGGTSSDAAPPSTPSPAGLPWWHLRINSLQIEDGVVEFFDESTAVPFHGVLHHASFSLGPVSFPLVDAQTSFAIRAELIGQNGDAAPAFCSGWMSLTARNLQASCQLEPISLSAFEPYYQGQGRVQVRAYNATLKSTSQWVAKSNELTGRLQFELGNLTEGDLSVRGKTVMDVKKLGGREEPRLTAELQMTGPLDAPSQWHSSFVPGDLQVQQLLEPLLNRGIEIIKVSLWGRKIDVSIAPTSPAEMTGVEEVSKQVQEELEILAAPIPQVAPGSEQPPAAPAMSESTTPVTQPSPEGEATSSSAAGTEPSALPPAAPTTPKEATRQPDASTSGPAERPLQPPVPSTPAPTPASPSGS